MGSFAEDCATKYQFSRKEQDEFAKSSCERAQLATKNNWFADEIITLGKVAYDEGPTSAKIEKISQLKPAFKVDGTVTAANSSSISDGAAALILMPASIAKKLNITPLAKIIAHSTHAEDPAWFTTAPIDAIKKVLEKTKWKLRDVDLFEINEAFAVVTMITMQKLGIPYEKVNIHGGACVLGHPIGASGARILTTLLYALRRKKLKKGIATLCIGGGEATAIAIELC